MNREEVCDPCFPTLASEGSNLNTNDFAISQGLALNGMNAMRIGSPVWTRFEPMRPEARPIRTAEVAFRPMVCAPSWHFRPSWAPRLAKSRTRHAGAHFSRNPLKYIPVRREPPVGGSRIPSPESRRATRTGRSGRSKRRLRACDGRWSRLPFLQCRAPSPGARHRRFG